MEGSRDKKLEDKSIKGSSLPFKLRFPAILSNSVTDRLLGNYHQRVADGSTDATVNYIRQRFHAQNLRAEIKDREGLKAW